MRDKIIRVASGLIAAVGSCYVIKKSIKSQSFDKIMNISFPVILSAGTLCANYGVYIITKDFIKNIKYKKTHFDMFNRSFIISSLIISVLMLNHLMCLIFRDQYKKVKRW